MARTANIGGFRIARSARTSAAIELTDSGRAPADRLRAGEGNLTVENIPMGGIGSTPTYMATDRQDSRRTAADLLRPGEGDLTFEDIPPGGPAPVTQAPQTARGIANRVWPASNGQAAQAPRAGYHTRVRAQEDIDLEAGWRNAFSFKEKRLCGRFSNWWALLGCCLFAVIIIGAIAVANRASRGLQ